MRLPLSIPLDERDGTSNQDGRMTNMVAEQYEDKSFIGARPGLNRLVSQVGTANGVVCYDGTLISLYGADLFKLVISSDTVSTFSPASGACVVSSGVFANGVFVAISGGGFYFISSSADGITWTQRHVPVGTSLMGGIAYGNGVFVVVDRDGNNIVITSSDGISWSESATPTSGQEWEDVAFGNGVFVAVAGNGTGKVMRSTDGVSWTVVSSAITESNNWDTVAFGNGRFIAATGLNYMISDDNGLSWFASVLPFAVGVQAIHISYLDDMFILQASTGVGVGSIYTSVDGISWNQRVFPTSASGSGQNRIVILDGLFVFSSPAFGSFTTIASSSNLSDWSVLVSNTQMGAPIASSDLVSIVQQSFNPCNVINVKRELISSGTLTDSTYDFAQSST